MPIYEYKRPDGTTFEVLQSFSDPPLSEDPETGVPVTRVLHAPAVHFKGKGFYNTDYGTRRRKREDDGASKSEDKSDKSEAKKAEPAAKAEPAKKDGPAKPAAAASG